MGVEWGEEGENRKWEDNTLQLTLNRQRGRECGGGDACVKAGAQSGKKCAGGDMYVKGRFTGSVKAGVQIRGQRPAFRSKLSLSILF